MNVIDDRGRVFGRINLIDACAALFLFVCIPVAYGAYLLFRTPIPRLVSVSPKAVYYGPNQHVQIQGVDLRPFMRVAFGTVQGLTFSIASTSSAQVDLPDLLPGVYDVVLYDYKQEADRLPKALTVLSLAPITSISMEITGSFKGLNETMVREFHADQKLANGDIAATIVRVGVPVPSTYGLMIGDRLVTLPVAGQLELPASVRVSCYSMSAGDGTVRCMVPGPQHQTAVAPGGLLSLPGPRGWVNFQIASVALPVSRPTVEVRAEFSVAREIAAMVAVGDMESDILSHAVDERARIVSVTRAGSADPARLLVTLRLPVVNGPMGWLYNDQPVKAGLPLRFETASYVMTGQLLAVNRNAGGTSSK